jgi:hypothetical protein
MSPAREDKQNRNWIRDLIIGLTCVAAGAFLNSEISYRSGVSLQNRASAQIARDAKDGKFTEFTDLVGKMSTDLTSGDYPTFHHDATIFRDDLDSHAYQKSLALDYNGSDFEYLANAARGSVSWYLIRCGAYETGKDDWKNCSADARNYLRPPIEQLHLALLSRLNRSGQ